MKKIIYILLFIFCYCCNELFAQPNLVPNGDFEQYKNCPYVEPDNTARAAIDTNYNIRFWFGFGGYAGNGLYFNNCANTNTWGNRVGTPQNLFGYQMPKSGNGYAGLTITTFSFDGFHPQISGIFNDYLCVKLKMTCISRLKYFGHFYLSACGLSREQYYYFHTSGDSNRFYTTSSIGMYLGNEVPSLQKNRRLELPAQIKNNPTCNINDTINWIEVGGSFESNGNETYLLLGNFNDSISSIFYNSYGYSEPWSGKKWVGATYFIDDVSLIPQNTTHYYDTLLCANVDLLLGAVAEADSFEWNDGNKTNKLRNFSNTGLVWVKSWFYGGTVYMWDSFNLVPTGNLQSGLGTDTFICYGQTQINLISSNANPAATFLWFNGDTTISSIIKNTDLVNSKAWLSVKERYCTQTDTINIKELNPIQIPISDTTTCFDDVPQILLDAGANFKSYLWLPTGETTKTIYSSIATVFKLTVTDSLNCTNSKNILVDEFCKTEAWLPNAFTPNGDNLNDTYKPVLKTKNIISYELKIFDSWGTEIFSTTDYNIGWDARDASTGVYVATLKYQYKDSNPDGKKSSITLLR